MQITLGRLMNNQKGAALIIVLVFLAVSLMLGLTSMQSSMIDERLAGNYKAAVQAQMGAEEAASMGWGNFKDATWEELSTSTDLKDLAWVDLEKGIIGSCKMPVSCYYRYFKDGDDKYIVAMGGVKDGGVSVSEPIFLKVEFGGGHPFDAVVNAYEDVVISGSGKIDAKVVAGRDLKMNGGVSPPADASVGGKVDFPSWWQYNKKYMSTIEDYEGGNVYPNGFDVLGVRKKDGSLGEFFTDIMGQSSSSLVKWFEDAGRGYAYTEEKGGVILTGGSGDKDSSTTYLGSDGQTLFLEVSGNLATQGRLSELVVRGDVTLIVDGDFDLGNNVRLMVADGASLSVYTTGKVRLGGGTSLISSNDFVREMPDGSEKPAAAIYSSYQQSSGAPGVSVSGANQSQVAIYAPYSDVKITGSGKIIGSVRGRNVELSGAGEVIFPEKLDDVKIGGSGGKPSFKWLDLSSG